MTDGMAEHVERAAACHVRWMRAVASAAGHEPVESDGATSIFTDAPARETMLAIRSSAAAGGTVSAFATWSDEVGVDRAVAWADRLTPEVGAAMAVHGFSWMGRPTWMRRPLREEPPSERSDVVLATPLDLATYANDLLPCLNPATADLRRAMARRSPTTVRHYISWVEGRPVGQASACIDLETQTMSVHDAYLLEDERPTGIGLNRVLDALDHHRREGVRDVYVAAEEEGQALYRMFGFEPVGTGQSWIRFPLEDRSGPSAEDLAAAAAIAADAPGSVATMMQADGRFANGMSAMDLAAAIDRPEAAQSWLDDHLGDHVTAAWRLGRRAEVTALLEERPTVAGHPLHEAIVDNDRVLVDLLLDAGIDPDDRDQRGLTAVELAASLRRYPLSAKLRRFRRERSQR